VWSCHGGNSGNAGITSIHHIKGRVGWTVPVAENQISIVVFDGKGNGYYCSGTGGETPEYFLTSIYTLYGATRWRKKIPTAKYGRLITWDLFTPAVDASGNVYVVSLNGILYAYRGKDGGMIWRCDLHPKNTHGAISYPICWKSIVFTNTASGCCAVNATTGKKIWDMVGCYLQAVSDKAVYVASEKGIQAIQHNTGKLIREFPVAGGLVYKNGFLYTTEQCSTRFSRWDAETGKIQWSVKKHNEFHSQDVAFAGNSVYKAVTNPSSGMNFLNEYNLQTGKSRKVKSLEFCFDCGLLVDSDGCIFTQTMDSLWAVDIRTGKIKWKIPMKTFVLGKTLSISPEGWLFMTSDQSIRAVE